MASEIKIRPLKTTEISYLGDFLYDAIFIPDGIRKPKKEIIHLPQLAVYIRDFGKKDDLCLVAELNGVLIGAAWARIYAENEKGFGFVNDKTPELSMSVKKDFRNKGVGTKLLSTMLKALYIHGYEQVSLSVSPANYAIDMYRKFGFEAIKYEGESVTMVKKTDRPKGSGSLNRLFSHF